MDKIWSDNRYVNLCINILLFLTGINFLHYGQLILPVICFILFVDNRLRFKVNNPKIFIVLCLFAVSFYAFSSTLGFYSVMGFTLPMAYYIGSNMHEPNEGKIKKMIYLFAIGMSLHVILNAIYEYIVHGHHGFFMSSSHYDFWTKDKISNTSTAINIDLILGCVYYLVFHEKNKKMKIGGLLCFLLSMMYLMVIGRRTPVMMLFIVFALSFLFETYYLKTMSEGVKKRFTIIASIAICFVVLLVSFYALNLFNCQEVLNEYRIVGKFTKGFINDQRFELYFGSFKLMPQYLWGGQHISTILGEQVHDFWIDIYDCAGIISCGIMMVYSVMYFMNILKTLKSSVFSGNFRILCLGVFTCIVIQMFLEPVMTGASLFLILSIIINALTERLVIDEK